MKLTFINFLIILLIIFLLGTTFFIKKSKLSKKHQNIEHYTSDDTMNLQVQILGSTPETTAGEAASAAALSTQSTTQVTKTGPAAALPTQSTTQTSGTNNAQSSTIRVRYPYQDSPEQNCSLGVCNDESKCEIVTGQGLRVQKTDCIPISPYTLYAQSTTQTSGTNNNAQPSTIKVRYPNQDSPEQNCSLGVCNDESKCEVVTGQGLRVQKTDCIPISSYTLYAQSNNPAHQ